MISSMLRHSIQPLHCCLDLSVPHPESASTSWMQNMNAYVQHYSTQQPAVLLPCHNLELTQSVVDPVMGSEATNATLAPRSL